MTHSHSIPSGAGNWSRTVPVLLAMLRIGVGALLFGSSADVRASTVVRHLPAAFAGTNTFEVVLEVAPSPDVMVYAVQEVPPPGWKASSLSEGGVVDGAVLKWGPFIGATSRSLKYVLAASVGATNGFFQGAAEFDSGHVEVTGDNRLGRLVGRAARTLPVAYTPGVPMLVSIAVVPTPESRVWALEEEVPSGWTPSLPSHGGVWDPSSGRIRWGVFSDAVPRALTYQVTPPAVERAQRPFRGMAQFGATSLEVGGSSSLGLQPSRLSRRLPDSYVAGESLAVQIDCQPAIQTGIHAIEEAPPPGVPVESIDPPGVLDVQTGKIKWGPFVDRSARTLGYRLRPNVSTRGALMFEGMGVFDNVPLPVSGPASLVRLGTVTKTECLRSVASAYVPGSPLVIQLQLKVADGITTVAVEDTIPAGWGVGAILQGGNFDALNHKVKWLWPGGTNSVVLSYTVTPPLNVEVAAEFNGVVQTDRESAAIGGLGKVDIFRATLIRTLPEVYFQGTPIDLLLICQPSPRTRTYSVEESLPVGWTVVSVEGGGAVDSVLGRLKWGPFSDSAPRQFNARILPPPNTTGAAEFQGVGVFDTVSVVTAGVNRILGKVPEVADLARAKPDVAEFVVNQPAAIPVSVLLANDDGGASGGLRVSQVNAKSLKGASVSWNGTTILYTPSAGFGGLDLFNYQIINGSGSTSASYVLMYPLTDGVTPVERLASIETLGTGGIRLQFAGIPGLAYAIQGLTEAGAADWRLLGTRTADASGRLEFVDLDAVGRSMRFYRASPP